MNQRRPTRPACGEHSGHEARIRNNEKLLCEYHKDHIDIWSAIKTKVDMKIFSLLIVLIIGNLGFQLSIYDTVKEIEKDVAVVKAEVRADISNREDERAENGR